MPERCPDCGQIISQTFHDCPGIVRDPTANPHRSQTAQFPFPIPDYFIICEHGTIGRWSECFNGAKED